MEDNMKILWFIPTLPKAVLERQRRQVKGTGFWIHSLINELSRWNSVELVVAYVQTVPAEEFEHDGVKYFSIPGPDHLAAYLAIVWGPQARRWDRKVLATALDIIGRVCPDVIHIHGTESIFGLIRVLHSTDVPTVLSIQGLMTTCAAFAWGDKTFWNMVPLQGLWDAARLFPSLRSRKRFLTSGRREVEIIRSVDAVLGRTAWDQSYVWSVAPKIKYFHVDELMRPEFFESQWILDTCQRHRIYTSGRLTFLKGMHVFLEAMVLLKGVYPNLDVRIAGDTAPSCEYRYLLRQVRKMGLSDVVRFIGWISGPQIVKELQRSHVYANSSFIENGCNALQEAMLMAVPCVTGFVGGMTTTLEHRKTGLMYPRGNAFMLAYRIRELFEDDELAVAFGQAARMRAQARHAPDRVVNDLMTAYQAVANRSAV